MIPHPGADLELCVLMMAPTPRDGRLAESILTKAGVACLNCASMDELRGLLDANVGAVLIPEEAVLPIGKSRLTRWVNAQPPWSDLPILMLARPGADSAIVAQAMDSLQNVTVLERPMRIAALVSAARSALRARRRQYQIREYLAERERAELELRANDRRKDEFLAVLAHELRNPLAPIRNSLHVMRLAAGEDPVAVGVGEMMDRQVGHMVRLVDDLLEVSRITRGKIELRRERVDVATVVRSAVEASLPHITAAGHRFHVTTPDEPVEIDADPVRLAQILANLLNNAAKYTPEAGEIWLTVSRERDRLDISVRDTGVGIPPDMLGSVFELFTQIGGTTDRSKGGLGIGLTLVKSLVSLHGGSIEARSDGLGRGSEFIVRLPIGSGPGTLPAVTPKPAPTASLAARRVLVVDDNRDSAESLGILLQRKGAEVRVEYSGQDALAALDDFRPEVVLLDIGMPDMDGHEVAERIRQRREYDHILLIALTGWGQRSDRERSKAVGFDQHLIKPVDLDALRRLLPPIDDGSKG